MDPDQSLRSRRWNLWDWLLFAGIFPVVVILTLLRGEDPRRERPWQPGGIY